MPDDSTLGGYLDVHERPPAFQGPDGAAYSAAIYVDDTPDDQGRYGASILFVRWSEQGERPIGHAETPYLSFGATADEAATRIRALTLHEVKAQLDRAVTARKERPDW